MKQVPTTSERIGNGGAANSAAVGAGLVPAR